MFLGLCQLSDNYIILQELHKAAIPTFVFTMLISVSVTVAPWKGGVKRLKTASAPALGTAGERWVATSINSRKGMPELFLARLPALGR